MRTRVTLLTIALCLSVLTGSPAAATSCDPILPTAGMGHPTYRSAPKTFRHSKVWVYGDSITFQSWRDLRTRLGERIAVDARWGRGTSTFVSVLGSDVHRFPRHLPRLVVMASGTNDLYSLDSFAHQVRLARAVLPRRVRLIWVDPYVTTTPRWNLAYRTLSDVRGVKVVRWDRANLDATRTLLVDGIHVNAAGCTVRNKLIRQAIEK